MLQSHQNSTRRLNGSTVQARATVGCDDRRIGSNREIGSGSTKRSSLNPLERDSLLRRQALNQAQQGNYAAAIALLDAVINRNPDSASDYNNRGLLHFQYGQFEQALTDYDKSLQLNHRLAKVYNNRANCYAALGQLAEALADYETAIDLNPANLRAWLNQGITYRDLEMYSQAIENFDITLQVSQFLDDSNPIKAVASVEEHAYAERGRAYHLAGDWNCAVADYQRAIAQLSLTGSAISGSSYRLRLQVETWLNDLLSQCD